LNLEVRFRLLRALESNPETSQRALAEELGVSLGKTNYCLKALIDKGWVKAGNFSRSRHKHRYLYQLTPAGLAEKGRITGRFLKRKIADHEALTREIEQLRRELNGAKRANLQNPAVGE
jgi:EPS-associated MarR family transcriptional regulator